MRNVDETRLPIRNLYCMCMELDEKCVVLFSISYAFE